MQRHIARLYALVVLVLPQVAAFAPMVRSSVVHSCRPSVIHMKKRYEDAEDKRLSQGGSGGGIGQPNRRRGGGIGGGWGAYTNTESRRVMGADKGQMIRQQKLEAYLDNDLEASDGTFGRALAGVTLFLLLGGLVGIFFYYGGVEGLAAITEPQRRIRGI